MVGSAILITESVYVLSPCVLSELVTQKRKAILKANCKMWLALLF